MIQVNHWRKIHVSRWEMESAGRNSEEDVQLVVYLGKSGRWVWKMLDANDLSLIESGHGSSAADAKRQATLAASY